MPIQGKQPVAAEKDGKGDDGDGRRHRRQQDEAGPDHLVADHEGGESDDDVAQDDIAHDDPEQGRKEEGAGTAKDVAVDFHRGEGHRQGQGGQDQVPGQRGCLRNEKARGQGEEKDHVTIAEETLQL